MTKSTDSRNIRQLVNSILVSYGIDDLALESNLSSGLLRYLQERMTNRGRDKAAIRAEILAELQIGATKATTNDAMESRIFQATGLYVNERWHTDGVIAFLIEKDAQGETIEQFAKACKDDPFTMPKFFKIAEKPSYLKDTWGLANFAEHQEEKPPVFVRYDPEEDKQYAPPPENSRPRILR